MSIIKKILRFISKKFSLTEIVKPNDPLTDEFGVAEYPNEKEKAIILSKDF